MRRLRLTYIYIWHHCRAANTLVHDNQNQYQPRHNALSLVAINERMKVHYFHVFKCLRSWVRAFTAHGTNMQLTILFLPKTRYQGHGIGAWKKHFAIHLDLGIFIQSTEMEPSSWRSFVWRCARQASWKQNFFNLKFEVLKETVCGWDTVFPVQLPQ